jgi:hypothetical protein
VTDEHDAPRPTASASPIAGPAASAPPIAGSRRRQRLVVTAFCLVLIAVVAVAITDVSRSSSGSTPVAATSATDPVTAQAFARLDAIRALLRRRSAAVVHHNRAAFVSTVDPANHRFRRRQARMLTNLRRVHFASWSYETSGSVALVPARARRRYHAPTWAFADVTLHYRIAGFDQHPTALPQYPTFVERNGRWYLGSLTDFTSQNQVSSTDLWDYAPVHVVHRRSVLVLGPKSQLPTMAGIATSMQAAIPRVDAVWGRGWAQRVVVLVPATQREMSRITADNGNLDQIAALTSSEFGNIHGRDAPVGDRVTINPSNWPTLGTLGASIVLTHELTHVATRAATSLRTPKWLSEGFADYVGFRTSGVPVSLAGAELAAAVHSGQLSHHLPGDAAFRGGSRRLPQAYESGWMACRYIAGRYGEHKLVRFYRAVGHSGVAGALRHLFGLSTRRFTRRWRGFVQAQLA